MFILYFSLRSLRSLKGTANKGQKIEDTFNHLRLFLEQKLCFWTARAMFEPIAINIIIPII